MTTALTRAEAAYLHLAGFRRGDEVHVEGRTFPRLCGVVTLAQQHDYADINRVYLIVTSGDGTVETRVTVGLLLAGMMTVTLRSGAGSVRRFGKAGYVPEG